MEQPLFGDASVVFYLMTNLKSVMSALGNRGYKAAQFEAGVIAGKVYLSAYSLSMGASGSTFYATRSQSSSPPMQRIGAR